MIDYFEQNIVFWQDNSPAKLSVCGGITQGIGIGARAYTPISTMVALVAIG